LDEKALRERESNINTPLGTLPSAIPLETYGEDDYHIVYASI